MTHHGPHEVSLLQLVRDLRDLQPVARQVLVPASNRVEVVARSIAALANSVSGGVLLSGLARETWHAGGEILDEATIEHALSLISPPPTVRIFRTRVVADRWLAVTVMPEAEQLPYRCAGSVPVVDEGEVTIALADDLRFLEDIKGTADYETAAIAQGSRTVLKSSDLADMGIHDDAQCVERGLVDAEGRITVIGALLATGSDLPGLGLQLRSWDVGSAEAAHHPAMKSEDMLYEAHAPDVIVMVADQIAMERPEMRSSLDRTRGYCGNCSRMHTSIGPTRPATSIGRSPSMCTRMPSESAAPARSRDPYASSQGEP